MSADGQRNIADAIIRKRTAANTPPSLYYDPKTRNLVRAAEQNIDHSTMGYGGPAEWLDHLSATMDATKEVLSYLKAQASLDMFAHNPNAKRLYTRIINAGITYIFDGDKPR